MKKNDREHARVQQRHDQVGPPSWRIRKIASASAAPRATRVLDHRRTRPAGERRPPAGSARRPSPTRACRCGRSRRSQLARPAVTSTAPATSKCRSAPSRGAAGGDHAQPEQHPDAPSGTLTAKIAGQPRLCVRMPPSSAPEEAPRPPIAPQTPSARLRSAPPRRRRDDRQRRRRQHGAGQPLERARAEQHRRASRRARRPARDSAKAPVPTMNTGRRPSRSAARPPSSRKPANVSV